MTQEIRVLIVDDPANRAALCKAASAGDGTVVLSEAGFGSEAFTAAREARPQVAVISLEEPIAPALRTIESLSTGDSAPAIVVVSSSSDREHIRKAMLAGARDYMVKPIKGPELQRAIAAVVEAEQRRRELSASGRARHQGTVIAIFGGKGGIGKTSLSINLAAAIAQHSKQRVALVDADTQLGDIAIMLDIIPEHTMADAVAVVDRLEPELLQTLLHRDPSGVHVLVGPLHPEEGESISGHHIAKIVEVAAKTYDYVVVDTAPRFTDTVLPILDAAAMVLLVTAPEVPALKNTKLVLSLMKSWHYSEDKVKLVFNHAYASNGVVSADAESSLDYPIFWKVPHDAAIPASIKLARPAVEVKSGSKVAQNIVALAQSICGIQNKRQGFVSKLFKR